MWRIETWSLLGEIPWCPKLLGPGGGFKYLFFSPLLVGNDPIWLIFSDGLKPPPRLYQNIVKLTVTDLLWSNYSGLTRPGPPRCSRGREIRLFHRNLGWWNIIIWPESPWEKWFSWKKSWLSWLPSSLGSLQHVGLFLFWSFLMEDNFPEMVCIYTYYHFGQEFRKIAGNGIHSYSLGVSPTH